MSDNDWLAHGYGSLREELLRSLRPEVTNYRHDLYTKIAPTLLQQVSRAAMRIVHEGAK